MCSQSRYPLTLGRWPTAPCPRPQVPVMGRDRRELGKAGSLNFHPAMATLFPVWGWGSSCPPATCFSIHLLAQWGWQLGGLAREQPEGRPSLCFQNASLARTPPARASPGQASPARASPSRSSSGRSSSALSASTTSSPTRVYLVRATPVGATPGWASPARSAPATRATRESPGEGAPAGKAGGKGSMARAGWGDLQEGTRCPLSLLDNVWEGGEGSGWAARKEGGRGRKELGQAILGSGKLGQVG